MDSQAYTLDLAKLLLMVYTMPQAIGKLRQEIGARPLRVQFCFHGFWDKKELVGQQQHKQFAATCLPNWVCPRFNLPRINYYSLFDEPLWMLEAALEHLISMKVLMKLFSETCPAISSTIYTEVIEVVELHDEMVEIIENAWVVQ